MTGFSGRLRQLRLSQGLSQEKLSELTGISGITLSRYERGASEPSLENLRVIAEALGVSVSDLIGEPSRPISNAHTPSLTRQIPIRGYVSAGIPREAWELDLGTVSAPESILADAPRAFALIISGDSLMGDGIHDGDLVVIDPDASYQVGRIYIVRTEEGEITAKHLELGPDGQMVLRASNDGYQDLRVTNGRVLGRVIWHMRRM